jgi:hypothetical protein
MKTINESVFLIGGEQLYVCAKDKMSGGGTKRRKIEVGPGVYLLLIGFVHGSRAAWDIEGAALLVQARDTYPYINVNFSPTAFQYLFPAPFGELFSVFDVVGNQTFSVITRKLTDVDFYASEEHLECSFNLFIF